MRRAARSVIAMAIAALALSGVARAAAPESCKQVSFSDVGWSCITATTAIASTLLKGLGYAPKSTVLSVPVTFQSLANGDIDAFLGLWLPTQQSMIEPYLKKKQIEKVATNLTGAKYTLAVPHYVYAAGVHSFADLHKYGDKFHHKIYGIEPGNDGNKIIQEMISKNAFDLGSFELVASSEQGMLTQVARAIRAHDWIVFLGWEPHPMNRRFNMNYLAGGDDYFGPNYGGATVYTLATAGYTEKCSNVGRLLKNLTFSLDLENQAMHDMLDEGMDPEAAAKKIIKEHPALLDKWLAGVKTFDGKNGEAAVKAYLHM